MGSVIASVGIARERVTATSSVALQVSAAKGCLRACGIGANDVGVLINAGVYRDHNIVEPAIASFIQRKIGANAALNGTPGTFSFDIDHGGCGLVTGLMIADGLLRSDPGRYGLVVAGDKEPVADRSVGFSFEPSAVAVLLAEGPEDAGFLAFHNDTDESGLDSCSGRIEWEGGNYQLVMHQSDTYADECLALAQDGLDALLGGLGLEIGDVDLMVPSQSPPRFVHLLRNATGLGDKVIDVTRQYGNVHTAGPGMALEVAMRQGRLAPGARVVFVTVGAGVASSLALYRVPA
jgi:3-oxoacyl-[acyl-carrier-protein] synthase III